MDERGLFELPFRFDCTFLLEMIYHKLNDEDKQKYCTEITTEYACELGAAECLKWLLDKKCPINKFKCLSLLVQNGHTIESNTKCLNIILEYNPILQEQINKMEQSIKELETKIQLIENMIIYMPPNEGGDGFKRAQNEFYSFQDT